MRYSNLFEKLLDKELLSKAFDNAARGKKDQPSVLKAIAQKDELVEKLYNMLKDGTYHPSRYQVIHKYEPKYREIFVAPFFPERVLHHAIMIVLIPILERKFYEHSYSCIRGKGQHRAVVKNQELVVRYKYCLKCDISKFYPSVNRTILLKIFKSFIKDDRFIELLNKIIFSAPGSEWEALIRGNLNLIGLKLSTDKISEKEYKKLKRRLDVQFTSCISTYDNYNFYKLESDTNVPIGNYCSQWFGNLYLTELDNLITNRFNPNDKRFGEYFPEKVGYIRYCDDFILYSDDKSILNNSLSIIEQYLFYERNLLLSKKKLYPTNQGVDFCGYKVFPDRRIKVRGSTKRRIRKKIRQLIYKMKHGYTTINKATSIAASYNGITKFSNSSKLSVALGIDRLLHLLSYYRNSYPNKTNNIVRLEVPNGR